MNPLENITLTVNEREERNMTETKAIEGREVVHTIERGLVVIDILRKEDVRTGRIFYDYRTSRKIFTPDGDEAKSAYCRMKDALDNIRALADVMEWNFKNRA